MYVRIQYITEVCMVNKNMPKISLITDLNKKRRFRDYRLYLRKYLYKILGAKSKYEKYSNFIKYFGLFGYGHFGIIRSLVDGLNELKIPFSVNTISQHTEIVIILWTDEKQLEYLTQLRKDGKIKVLITTPECDDFRKSLKKTFVENEYTDLVLLASDWIANLLKQKSDPKNAHKIYAWPSGVKLPLLNKNDNKKYDCIVYFKEAEISEELISILNKYDIKYKTVVYGKYLFNDWIKNLKESRFTIFYQSSIETQGLAHAESWAYGLPSIVKYNINKYGRETLPYLTEKTGIYFKNFNELENIILQYKQNPEKFLSKFDSYNWVKNNMTDVVSVKKLFDLIDTVYKRKN